MIVTNILSRADGQELLPILAPHLDCRATNTLFGPYSGRFLFNLIVPEPFEIKNKIHNISGNCVTSPVFTNHEDVLQCWDWRIKNWGSWSLGLILTADRDELLFDTENGEPRPIIQHLADLHKIELKLISSWEGKGCEDVKPIIFKPNTNCIQL